MRPLGIARPRDLTEGSVLRNVIFMGVPSMIGFATTTICALADVFFLGLMGSSAVAGMTLLLAFAGVLGTTNSLVGAGSVAVISRRFGEKDYERTENAIKQTLLLKLCMALISGTAGLILLRSVLSWMNAEPEAARLGSEYGVWFFIGLPFNFCSWSMFTAFRGMGDAHRAMSLMIMTTVLNILLAPVLIFERLPTSLSLAGLEIIPEGTTIGLGLGVSGSSIAKGVSVFVCCLIGTLMLHSKRSNVTFRFTRGWKPDLAVMTKILKIGTPPGLEAIARSVAGLLTAYFVALFGTAVVAAFGFAQQILGFTLVVAVGMMLGSSAIVGHCLGAGRKEMARRTVKTATGFVLLICVPLSVLTLIFAPQIMAFFTDESDVAEVGVTALRIMVLAYLLHSVKLALVSAFNGSGNTLPPTIITLSAETLRLGLIAAFIYIFFAFFERGTGIWWAFLIASLFETLLMAVWYRKGRWLERSV